MNIPAPIMKLGSKACKFFVKHGPKIMSVGGGLMAVGGAVMACEATMHADEVLERHKQKMAKIEAAKRISDEAGDGGFTEKDVKRSKAGVYFETAVDFAKLYGPSVAVGMSGVGMMQAAYHITEVRRANAVAALTTLDQMYQGLLAKGDENPEVAFPAETRVVNEGTEDETEQLVLDPENQQDPFFFIFDVDNTSFENTFGNKRVEFLTNERFLTAAIDAYNYRLSSHAVDHVWLNDILKAWGMEDTSFGQFYGWNAATGDQIEYEITPFVKEWNEESDKQFPLLVEIDRERFEELEAADIQEGYCIGIRLLSSTDGHDDICNPRFIYNEVYGD